MIPQGIRELETLLTSLKSREQEITTIRQQLDREREEIVRQGKEIAGLHYRHHEHDLAWC